MSKAGKLFVSAVIVACAFSAMLAATVQAAPHWTKEGENPFTGTETIVETATLTPRVAGESPATAELTIPGLGVTTNATGVKVKGGVIKESSRASATSLVLTGVTITGAAGCKVRNVGGTFGTVETKPLQGELATIGSTTYILFSPVETNFVTVEIAKVEGKTCAVSGTYAKDGTAAFQVGTETMLPTVLGTSSEAIQKASGKELRFANKPVYIDAVADLSLTSGKNWGVALKP